jgi:prenyltransferase beta subunit
MGLDQEGHGGSTYCAVSSLALLRKLDKIRNKRALIKWCVNRQGGGFQGRPYKDPDTCYSYWIGATMKILGSKSSSLLGFQLTFHQFITSLHPRKTANSIYDVVRNTETSQRFQTCTPTSYTRTFHWLEFP